MTEVRFEFDKDDLSILDGFCQATGASRVDVMRGLLTEWTRNKRHEVILICRVAGINPGAPEPDRKVSRFHG